MRPASDDERTQQQNEYDKARSEGIKEIYAGMWKWDAYIIQASENAADLIRLMEMPPVDVAYCWLRKVLNG